MSIEINGVQPFEVTKTRSFLFSAGVIIVGLILLILSNVSAWQKVTFLGGSLTSLFGNLGFTAVTLAAFQILYDTQQREVFFREIRNEISGSESVRKAGISHITNDSKRLNLSNLVKQSRHIEVGVAYSDRFVKDYLSLLQNRTNLTLVYYMADTSDDQLVSSLAFMTRRDKEHVTRSAKTLTDFLDQIRETGTKVVVIPVCSISHYSFIRFDQSRTFLNLSTFSSRRADVPSIDIPFEGFLHQFITDDINCALKATECPAPSKHPSKSFLRSILPKKS